VRKASPELAKENQMHHAAMWQACQTKYGKHKICDERFYFCWVPGLVELIFPDWFDPELVAQGRSSGNALG
jgi:hypothetical protein